MVVSRELCEWTSSQDGRVTGLMVRVHHQPLVKHQTSVIHSWRSERERESEGEGVFVCTCEDLLADLSLIHIYQTLCMHMYIHVLCTMHILSDLALSEDSFPISLHQTHSSLHHSR